LTDHFTGPATAELHIRLDVEADRRVRVGEDARVVALWVAYDWALIEQAWAPQAHSATATALARAEAEHSAAGTALDAADAAKQKAADHLRTALGQSGPA